METTLYFIADSLLKMPYPKLVTISCHKKTKGKSIRFWALKVSSHMAVIVQVPYKGVCYKKRYIHPDLYNVNTRAEFTQTRIFDIMLFFASSKNWHVFCIILCVNHFASTHLSCYNFVVLSPPLWLSKSKPSQKITLSDQFTLGQCLFFWHNVKSLHCLPTKIMMLAEFTLRFLT